MRRRITKPRRPRKRPASRARAATLCVGGGGLPPRPSYAGSALALSSTAQDRRPCVGNPAGGVPMSALTATITSVLPSRKRAEPLAWGLVPSSRVKDRWSRRPRPSTRRSWSMPSSTKSRSCGERDIVTLRARGLTRARRASRAGRAPRGEHASDRPRLRAGSSDADPPTKTRSVFAADTTGRAGDSVCQLRRAPPFSSTLAASSPALPLGRAGTFAAVACAREAVLLTSGPPPSQSPPPRARAPRPEPRRTRVRRPRTAQRETRPRPAIPRPRATTERCPPRCPRR